LDCFDSECAEQDRADEDERDEGCQHIQPQGQVHDACSLIVYARVKCNRVNDESEAANVLRRANVPTGSAKLPAHIFKHLPRLANSVRAGGSPRVRGLRALTLFVGRRGISLHCRQARSPRDAAHVEQVLTESLTFSAA
jgi:hypothetical protein